MPDYFLGVDIGGSKSHALIADDTGHVLGFGKTGPGSHEVVGYEGLAATLHTITDQAVESAGIAKGQIRGAGFGIAGYDWPSERAPTFQAIRTLNLNASFDFVNDAIIGLMAGASVGWGVSVVAGTGCNCRGRDRQGREGRVTGCGSAFAEYGGGIELVMKAVQAISLAWSLRGPATKLTQMFVQYARATDVVDLLEGLSRGRYRVRSDAAPLVFATAADGDPVAAKVIHWGGRELGSLAVGVIRQLEFEALDFDVVLAGSLYKGSPVLAQAMSEVIHPVAPGARFTHLTAPPVIGGVILGMEQAGLEYRELRETLIESTKELLGDSN